MTPAVWLFWTGTAGIVYAYAGYPVLLVLLARFRPKPIRAAREATPPTVSLIVPVYNEAPRMAAKVANTSSLRYPTDRLQVIYVSDGSTDDTVALIRASAAPDTTIVELPARRGKAAALNAGLEAARHEVVVFSDASIWLQPDALQALVAPFSDPSIGCVSGEDRIEGSDGEGLYGRYELALRRLESSAGSIVGASGSFYAQRRHLCTPFTEGLAPDFLSVLRTVQAGYRATSEPAAIGSMTSVKDPRQEFARKVRTLNRGLATLFAYFPLLNVVRYGTFGFFLLSHKLVRWLVPFFMITALGGAAVAGTKFYAVVFVLQVAFYLLAVAALYEVAGVQRSAAGRIPLYFTSANVAILVAWTRFARGVRQELWTPTQR